MFEKNKILFVSVVLSISQWRLNSKLKIYSSISMLIFPHSSLHLVCLPVKPLSIKPFIEAMMQNQVWTFYFYFWLLYHPGGHSLYLIFDQTVVKLRSRSQVRSRRSRRSKVPGLRPDMTWANIKFGLPPTNEHKVSPVLFHDRRLDLERWLRWTLWIDFFHD